MGLILAGPKLHSWPAISLWGRVVDSDKNHVLFGDDAVCVRAWSFVHASEIGNFLFSANIQYSSRIPREESDGYP